MREFFRCASCGDTYESVSPGRSFLAHRCLPRWNRAYQPDPDKPEFDPRMTLLVENPRDETTVFDTDFNPDFPRPPKPPRIRVEGKGRSLVRKED